MKDIRTLWKACAAAKEITSSDIAALCIYNSLRLEEDLEATKTRLRKSFTPISNPIKLDNGATPYGSLAQSLRSVKWSHFASWFPEEEATLLVERAKQLAKEF